MTAHPAARRLHDAGTTPAERTYAVWTHLSPLLASVVAGPFAAAAPLVLWMARRRDSAFADDHGREVVNMSITGALLFVAGFLTGIGMVVWVAWAIAALVGIIRGAIAAGEGRYFRYPMTIRFLK